MHFRSHVRRQSAPSLIMGLSGWLAGWLAGSQVLDPNEVRRRMKAQAQAAAEAAGITSSVEASSDAVFSSRRRSGPISGTPDVRDVEQYRSAPPVPWGRSASSPASPESPPVIAEGGAEGKTTDDEYRLQRADTIDCVLDWNMAG
jgi:hypothetical protein